MEKTKDTINVVSFLACVVAMVVFFTSSFPVRVRSWAFIVVCVSAFVFAASIDYSGRKYAEMQRKKRKDDEKPLVIDVDIVVTTKKDSQS